MKKVILTIINILVLSGCGMDHDDYLVRWWNGNIPTKLSSEEEKIWDICYRETKYLPENTKEEREKASLELTKCLRKKEKEFGIK